MKTNEQLWKICMNIYIELYKKAQPPTNFKKLIASAETKKANWFMNYYLSDKKMKQIINKYIKKYKLNKRDGRVVNNEILLGCSPTSNKKRWEKQDKVTIILEKSTLDKKLLQGIRNINLDGTEGMKRGVKT